jgi:16S rRNA (guanine966-N2)-methyltransferase
MLEVLRGPWADARVLDLYAGSGALGLEALSRGAASVVLVESDRAAAATIRANADAVRRPGLDGGVAGGVDRSVDRSIDVQQQAVARWLRAPARADFDVVFCDPPYTTSSADVGTVVVELAASGRLAAGALVVLERSARDPGWQWVDGFEPVRDRRYGEAHLWIARW